MTECVFCKIVSRELPSNIVYEDDEFIAFENIKKTSPVHIMVMPKKHVDKKHSIAGKEDKIWDNIFNVVHEIIKKYGLDKTGYRLVNNGAGYHGIDHEHIHVMGGKGWEPDDDL